MSSATSTIAEEDARSATSTIAEEDARSGRPMRSKHEFRDPAEDDMYCLLCLAGPFAYHGQRGEHEHGRKHIRNHRRYQELYIQEEENIEEERREREHARVVQLEMASVGRRYNERKQSMKNYNTCVWFQSASHLGDLKDVKSCLFDFMIQDDHLHVNQSSNALHAEKVVHEAYLRHIILVTADLLLLAFVRVQLIARFTSVDGYREHCVVHSQLNPLSGKAHWKQCLVLASEPGIELLKLVMPWIISQIVRNECPLLSYTHKGLARLADLAQATGLPIDNVLCMPRAEP